MQIEQRRWTADAGWTATARQQLGGSAQLVFTFGGARQMEASECLDRAAKLYPKAHVVGCTTAGEIQGTTVGQDSVVMTAIAFEHSTVAVRLGSIGAVEENRLAARRLVASLPTAGLRHVFLLAEGLRANASRVVAGARSALPFGVGLTGGFAGDGDRLAETLVWCDGAPERSAAVAIGFYGKRLKTRFGVTGPWGPFGPDRLVTKAKGNILYELDGRPALELYKTYLGEHAAALPASGLLFPLLFHEAGSERCVLRALIGVDEAEQSITFAGDVEEGTYARLMRGVIERLIGDSRQTAEDLRGRMAGARPDLSILVSCNGRRHVLKQRLEEELEAADAGLGGGTQTGFYSYGEIGPVAGEGQAELHNETLAITAFSET